MTCVFVRTVINIPDSHRQMRGLSRFRLRSPRGHPMFVGGSRVLAVLAILWGALGTARLERADAGDARLVASLSAPMPALHSVASARVAFSSRAHSRVPDIGPALPASEEERPALAVASRATARRPVEKPCASIASRGYDATAPPAVS